MERKFRYELCNMPEWNGRKYFKNGMEDNLPYFHINAMLDFAHGINGKIYTYSDNQKYVEAFSRKKSVDKLMG